MKEKILIEALKKSGYEYRGTGNDWGKGYEVVFQNVEDSSDIVKITVEKTTIADLGESSWYVDEMNFDNYEPPKESEFY
ncbi:hypothetical protein [Viridibacillus arvi]|uniref:hypothetical protein n=1 Tax=Viridibacillus arvi TaxID=263475 RepID=UPI0034CED826